MVCSIFCFDHQAEGGGYTGTFLVPNGHLGHMNPLKNDILYPRIICTFRMSITPCIEKMLHYRSHSSVTRNFPKLFKNITHTKVRAPFYLYLSLLNLDMNFPLFFCLQYHTHETHLVIMCVAPDSSVITLNTFCWAWPMLSCFHVAVGVHSPSLYLVCFSWGPQHPP